MTEKYDILTLDDGKDYVISEELEHNNKNYLLLQEIDENEDIIKENTMIVEKTVDNEDISLTTIEPTEESYEYLSNKFSSMLLKDTQEIMG